MLFRSSILLFAALQLKSAAAFSYCHYDDTCDMSVYDGTFDNFIEIDQSEESCIANHGHSYTYSDTPLSGDNGGECTNFCPFSYCHYDDTCDMSVFDGTFDNFIEIDKTEASCKAKHGHSWTCSLVPLSGGAVGDCHNYCPYSYCHYDDTCDMSVFDGTFNNFIEIDQTEASCKAKGGHSFTCSEVPLSGGAAGDCHSYCPYSYCHPEDDCSMQDSFLQIDGSQAECEHLGGQSWTCSEVPLSGAPGGWCVDLDHCDYSYCHGNDVCDMSSVLQIDQSITDCAAAGGWSFTCSPTILSGEPGGYCLDLCHITGICKGDPHFQTFGGDWYDFHGICDLVLVKADGFNNGAGLDIHIRTKARYEYSFIEAAAIKIGDDVLEVGSFGEYMVNGVDDVKMPFRMGEFTVTHENVNKKRHVFKIQTGEKDAIVIGSFKDMVSVTVENATYTNWATAEGMMGSFLNNGVKIGRDGKTVMRDVHAYGQEWQVRGHEGDLFQTPSPFKNQECVPPSNVKQGRRLGETISEEAADLACAHHKDETQKDMCVFDVIAMGDLEVAENHGAY